MIIFHSDKDLTRFEFFKRSIIILTCIIVGSYLFNFKNAHKNHSPVVLITFDIIVSLAALLWILTSRIVAEIQLDIHNKKFIVHFITVIKERNVLVVPLETMTFKFEQEQSRPKTRTLKVYDNNKKVFQIETNQDGFSQETLESLVQQLNKIQESKY